MAATLDQYDDATRSEIVQWFDDPIWRVSTVPTPIAFGAGLLLGAVAALLAAKLLED